MTDIDNGGPVFPESGSRGKAAFGEGMSMRDYIAVTILPAIYADYVSAADMHGYMENWYEGLAVDAYRMADAMLRARVV